jgi:hypothetical protein
MVDYPPLKFKVETIVREIDARPGDAINPGYAEGRWIARLKTTSATSARNRGSTMPAIPNFPF